ncbi:MAG: AAA family ATPase [Geminicoccaceae bacterium]
MDQLDKWLIEHRLERYRQRFHEQNLGFDVLPDLTESDLEALGLTLGDRKRFLRAQQSLLEDQASAGSDTGPEVTPASDQELRRLSILFVDLVDSVGLARRLDIEAYARLLRQFQDRTTRCIEAGGGFVAQFAGDGVLAYFGFPKAGEDDAERAVAVALDCCASLGQISVEDGTRLRARGGVATGTVLIHDVVTSRTRKSRHALGPIPNLAARLQGVAEPGRVVISETTHKLLRRNVVRRSLGRLELKGYETTIAAWVVDEIRPTALRFQGGRLRPTAPLVNRDDEFETLDRCWQRAKEGRAQTVLVSGEPGIGKSRLVAGFLTKVRREPHLRLIYQCSSLQAGSAFHPLTVQLSRDAGLLPSDTDQAKLDKLGALLAKRGFRADDLMPTLTKLLAIDPGERHASFDGQPETLKDWIQDGLMAGLSAVARNVPVIIVVEDLHWVDPSSETVLGRVIERMGDTKVLLIGTHRLDYAFPWIDHERVTAVPLVKLERRHALAMITGLCGKHRMPDALADRIWGKTQGVPIFVEEMVSAVLDRDLASADDGDRTELILPSTLHDLLLWRIDSIDVPRDLPSICALVGRRFDVPFLQAVTGIEKSELEISLGRLVEAGILERFADRTGGSYAFRHALVQDVAYEKLLRSRAEQLHLATAEVMTRRFPELAADQPEIVAHHYAKAEAHGPARDAWRKAAERAIARGANLEAVDMLRKALAENEMVKDDDQRRTVEVELREMLHSPLEVTVWGTSQVEQNLSRLYKLRRRKDVLDLFSVLLTTCAKQIHTGQIRRARSTAQRIVHLRKRTEAPVVRIMGAHYTAMSFFYLGQLPQAIEAFEEEIELAAPEHLDVVYRHYVADPAVVARCMQAWALLMTGDMDKSRRRLAETLRRARNQNHVFTRAYAHGVAAAYYHTADRPDDVSRQAKRALIHSRASREKRFPYWEAWSQLFSGWAQAFSGDTENGVKILKLGMRNYIATGSRQILPYGRVLLAETLIMAKRPLEANQVVEEIVADPLSDEIRVFEPMIERLRDRLAEGVQSPRHPPR